MKPGREEQPLPAQKAFSSIRLANLPVKHALTSPLQAMETAAPGTEYGSFKEAAYFGPKFRNIFCRYAYTTAVFKTGRPVCNHLLPVTIFLVKKNLDKC